MRNKRQNPVTKQLLSVSDQNAPFNYVEAYKMLCTNFEFITTANDCKNIMITSTLANEGKTNVAVNLARALAGYNKKVCLVECDFRRPTVDKLVFRSNHMEGLTDVLKGERDLPKAIRRVEETTMHLLPAGTIPPNPSELLSSEKMKDVIDRLSSVYDYIIYDTPPVLLVTDAATLGRYMDGAVFVVRHNQTERNLVLKAKKNLDTAGVKVLGAVYSMFNEKAAGSYYNYQSYDYYYDSRSTQEKR